MFSSLTSIFLPSPNFNERLAPLSMIILHYTGMKSCEAALARLTDVKAEVSSHYVIDQDGLIYGLVSEEKRAWHAGVSSWQGLIDINSRSIGIEIVNKGHEHGYEDFTEPQMHSVVALCLDITARHGLSKNMVLAHSDIAPLRKQDVGEKFGWGLLHQHGLGSYISPTPLQEGVSYKQGDEGMPVQALQSMLVRFGFGIKITGVYDDETRLVVTAFQRHFRPEKIDGVADFSTLSTLKNLLNFQIA